MLRTYQTKIKNQYTQYLDEAASFFGSIERKLFVDIIVRKIKRNSLKKTYIKTFKISARQFNSLYNEIDGKIKSFIECRRYQINQLKDKIESIKIAIQKQTNSKINLHQRLMENLKKNPKDERLTKLVKKYKNIKLLSGFAYKLFYDMIKSKASRCGVEVIEINPSYTSIIGQFKFMKRYGLSSHGSAACVIARRELGYKMERFPYVNPLGDFNFLKHKKTMYLRWSSLSNIIKNDKFSDRIEKLKS